MVSERTLKGVILVSFEYPPRRISIISDIVYNVANLLSKNNIKVWVITFDDWRTDIEVIKNITIHRIPYSIYSNISFLSTILNLKIAYQSVLASILHEKKIDIIHFFDWQALPLLISWREKLSQKIINTAISIQPTREIIDPTIEGLKKIEKMSLNAMDLIITDSKILADQMIKHYLIDEKKLITYPIKQKKYANKVLELYLQLINKK